MPLLPLGAGSIQSYPIPTPAAGAFMTLTVPSNLRWRLLTIQFQLTCSAVAGNRNAYVYCITGAAVEHRAHPNLNTFASSVTLFYGSDAGGVAPTSGPGRVFSIPASIFLREGDTINVGNNSFIDPGDQFDFGFVGVEEWVAP